MVDKAKKDCKLKTFLLRSITAIILYPLLIWLLIMGPWTTLALTLVVGVMAMVEWFKMTMNAKTLPQSTAFLLAGNAYIFLGLFIFWFLYLKLGWFPMAIILTATIISDTAAYVVGSILKGPKLIPSISPNKTWSGSIGSLVCTVLFGFLIGPEHIKAISFMPYVPWPIFLICLSIVAQLGDLLESWSKRQLNVKDSGHLIPGHGGILDRLDSMLSVMYFMAILSTILYP